MGESIEPLVKQSEVKYAAGCVNWEPKGNTNSWIVGSGARIRSKGGSAAQESRAEESPKSALEVKLRRLPQPKILCHHALSPYSPIHVPMKVSIFAADFFAGRRRKRAGLWLSLRGCWLWQNTGQQHKCRCHVWLMERK